MRRYSEAQISAELLPASEKDPEDWGATDKFTVVLVTAGFNATVLGIGLTTLQQWRRQFAGAGDALADRADFGVPGPVHCLRAQLLPGDRHLEPKGGGLGCRRAQGYIHRSGSGEQGLLTRAHQQGAPAAVDPASRQRPPWKAGWRSWVCCGPSPDQGLATTTPTPNRVSSQQNTGPIPQGGHSAAWKRHACG